MIIPVSATYAFINHIFSKKKISLKVTVVIVKNAVSQDIFEVIL